MTKLDKNPSPREIALEGAGPALDLILDKCFDSIPFLGVGISAVKTYHQVRDGLAIAKQQKFLLGMGTHSEEETLEFLSRIGADPEERAKLGSTLLMTLDQFTDFDKCALLGQVTMACAMGLLTTTELRRLAAAISQAFPDDLKEFLESDKEPVFSQEIDHFAHLELVGLTKNNGGFDGGMSSITPLGRKLREVTRAVATRNSAARST
jgi:hypothetical protein